MSTSRHRSQSCSHASGESNHISTSLSKAKKSQLWQAADILLSLPVINTFHPATVDKLKTIIENGMADDLASFFEEQCNKQKELKKILHDQIAGKLLKGKQIFSFSTLLAQVASDKRKSQLSAETKAQKINAIKKQKKIILDQQVKKEEYIRNRISNMLFDINNNQQKMDFGKKESYEITLKLNECNFKKERFAFLIKNQLGKKIPFYLRDFVMIARKMCLTVFKGTKTDSRNREAVQAKLDSFQEFTKSLTMAENHFQHFGENSKKYELDIDQEDIQLFSGDEVFYQFFEDELKEENKLEDVVQQQEEEEPIVFYEVIQKKRKQNEILD